MVKVEVRIWSGNKQNGPPLIIRGKNFTPLRRAFDIIDGARTDELINSYSKEMQKMLRGM